MATSPVPSPAIPGFHFERNLSLLNDQASLGFAVGSQVPADVAAALVQGSEFPFPNRDIDIAEVALRANTARPIEFGRGQDKISFTAEASAFAGLGVYHTAPAALSGIGNGGDDFLLSAVDFGPLNGQVLAVLRWGFDVKSKASGAMALGTAGQATLSVAGEKEGLFAVIRRLAADTPARQVVQETADSWILPKQIASISDVQPGTWIVSEVFGSLSATLKTRLGYDFNWIRETRLGGLTGDIGLRLQMGIEATLGYSSTGRCAVVVSRDSDRKVLRLRYYKLKTKQLDLAFNAALAAKPVNTLLPQKVDDFIAAVFDIHGQQIVRSLNVLNRWTDPEQSLAQLLANEGVDGAQGLIARMAGVTPDQLQQSFDRVHERVVSFVNRWNDLPQRTSSALLKLVEENADLTQVRAIAARLAIATEEDLRQLLNGQLGRIDFFRTPAGRFLESAVEGSILNLLSEPIERVREIGTLVRRILDGSATEDVLRQFQSFLETELKLDRILPQLSETGFNGLDALLKQKLANFLGTNQLVFADLEKARTALRTLLEKRNEYYDVAIAALNRTYNFELNAAYQRATTGEALFDAEFDFSAENSSAAAFLRQAISGNLDDLLTVPHAEVKLNAGRLTHGVRRQASVDVTLPFLKKSESHINESIASFDAKTEEGGVLFTLNSTDTVAGNRRRSVLSLALALPRAATGVRVHSESFTLNYSQRYARRNMRLKHLRPQIEPAARQFFPERIPDVRALLALIDAQTEEVIPNTPNVLGNGLVSLEVSLPRAVAKAAGKAWLSLPDDRKAQVYIDLSKGIQMSLKRTIHDVFFTDPDAYANLTTAKTILAYCSLMPHAAKPGILPGSFPYWDWVDLQERRTMLKKPRTIERMRELLRRAQTVLADDSDSQHFRPEDAASLLANVDPDDAILHGLLFAEAEMIKHAYEAGRTVGKFMDTPGDQPSEAIRALEKFGSRLTEAFNSDVSTLLGAGVRAIGPHVFLDAARAIDPDNTEAPESANAVLSIEFVKPEAPFHAAVLLAGGRVEESQLAVANRVVHLSA